MPQQQTMAEPSGDEHIPGTIFLVDEQHQTSARHAKGRLADVVLIPAPSSDPEDPLNWSPGRKKLSAFCMALYVLTIGICSSALYSTLYPLSEATGLSVGNLNAGTGYMFLLFGWGCIPWQAIALHYGKRPVYLTTLLGTMAVVMWQPYTTSNGQWIATKILQGIFGAPIESLGEISISDVFFTHERGTYISVYALALGYSNGIAPLIMGPINERQGWRWVFYWCAIICAATFTFCFFFMEETDYNRLHASSEISGESPNSITLEDQSEDSDLEHSKNGKDGPSHEEVHRPADRSHELDGSASSTPRSWWKRLRVIRRDDTRRPEILAMRLVRPLKFLRFPVISWTGFSYGVVIVWLAVINATQSLLLANPPYSFSTISVGYTFFAPLVGTTLAALYTGKFGDWLVIKLARRNGGTSEAEHRLYLLLLTAILTPAALILWGVGAAHEIHWFGLVVAMGTVSFVTSAGSQIWITYCIDSYHALGAEALVTVMILRNTVFFAVSYGVTPWVTDMGWQNAFLVAAAASAAHSLCVAAYCVYAKALRTHSCAQFARYVQQNRDAGLDH